MESAGRPVGIRSPDIIGLVPIPDKEKNPLHHEVHENQPEYNPDEGNREAFRMPDDFFLLFLCHGILSSAEFTVLPCPEFQRAV